MNSLTAVPILVYYIRKMKHQIEEITATKAAERLHMTSKGVRLMLERGALNGRLVSEAPRPYYLIAVDDKFLAEEVSRNEKALDQSKN
jgi:hypothetical protein